MIMHPNCQTVVRIETAEPEPNQPDTEAARLIDLWSDMAVRMRAITREPQYAELAPEFGGWGFDDPEATE